MDNLRNIAKDSRFRNGNPYMNKLTYLSYRSGHYRIYWMCQRYRSMTHPEKSFNGKLRKMTKSTLPITYKKPKFSFMRVYQRKPKGHNLRLSNMLMDNDTVMPCTLLDMVDYLEIMEVR